MTSQEGTQLLVPPPNKDEEDSSEALNKLKFHTKKMNWNLKILKDQLTGLEASGNSLSRQMASMYRTFQEMKEAGEISDVEIEIDEDELSPNSRMSDTTGFGSYDGLTSYSADDAMDTEDELEEYSDLETDSTTSSGQRKKKLYSQISVERPDNVNEKRKRLTHRKRQSSEIQCESDTDSECENGQCSCCMSRSSFGSVTPSKRYYFEDRSRADDTSSSSCSDYEEPIKRNAMPLHERHSPFYIPGQGNSSSEEEDMCQEDMQCLLTPNDITKDCRDGDSEGSLQKRLSPLGCESPIHYDSQGGIMNAPSGNESEDKSLEDKVKELTVELEHCKEEMNKRTQKRKKSKGNEDGSIEQMNNNNLPKVTQKQTSDNEADLSAKSESTLNSGKISDKRRLFEKDIKKDEQITKPVLKRKESIGNAMMDRLKAQFESSDAKKSGTLREKLGAKGRRDSIQDKIKMLEHKVQEESDKSDSSTLKSSSESRALQKQMSANRKLSKDLKNLFEKDMNQNDVSSKQKTSKQAVIVNNHRESPAQLLQIPATEKHSKKSIKTAQESKTKGTSKHAVKTPLKRETSKEIALKQAEQTPDADYEQRDKVASKKKFQELQSKWQPKLVVKSSGKQPKPELQKRIQRLQKAALNSGKPGSPKIGRRAVSRAVIHMNKKEKKEESKIMEFNPDSGEVIIGQMTETDKDGYKTVKLRGNGLVVTLKINPNGKSGKSGDVEICPSCHKHTDKESKKDVANEMRIVVPQALQNQHVVPQTIKHHRKPSVPQTIQIERMQPQTSQNQRRVSVPSNTQTIQLPVRKMSTSSITTYINEPGPSVGPGPKYITVTPSENYTNQAVPRVYVRPHQMNAQTGQQRITVIPVQAGIGDCPRFQLKSVSSGGNTVQLQKSKSTTRYTIRNPRQQFT
ncbi:uncharacterized protein LOC117115022 [Anneissia japonica]|uniref:uncharacterized protein LOC117115022 n=1 Tax=Anneissia japonica TaxID=1529436 RepID=UPI0014257F1B|nr:uncharacterized protein LOC117115022 [Anneissia japonica]